MILITHPGKLGDLLWALPTVRTLSRIGPVCLAVSPYCRPLVQLLEQQDYIEKVVVLEDWEIRFDAPVTPRIPPTIPEAEQVIHLGLDGWPDSTLPEAFAKLGRVKPTDEPWIRVKAQKVGGWPRLAIWTDEWVELKVGLLCALDHAALPAPVLIPPGSRLGEEFDLSATRLRVDIMGAARHISKSDCVITDKSALRVLAYAMGIPTIVVEPSPPRHNPVFDPPASWRKDVVVINGFDAREVVEAVRAFEGSLGDPRPSLQEIIDS